MAYTLVAFHAHPDDESLLTAGVMAKAAAEGHRVVLVVATAGEVGDAAEGYRDRASGDLGTTRTLEVRRSAEILGVARVEFLGYRDSGLDHSRPGGIPENAPAEAFSRVTEEAAAQRLATILRQEQADVLTTYDANGGYGHPDHLQVHRVGSRAAALAATPLLLEATMNRDLMQMGISIASSLGYEIPDDFNPENLDHWFTPGDAITHAVDVSAYIEAKKRSMQAHESQATSAQDGPRSISLFLSLPDEYFAMAFGTEWFIEAGRPCDPKATDIFASLTGSRS